MISKLIEVLKTYKQSHPVYLTLAKVCDENEFNSVISELEEMEKKISIGESYKCEGCGKNIFTSSYCDHCNKLWES